MVAIEQGPYQKALADFGQQQQPAAIIAISAHWDSDDTVSVSNAQRYRAVHDFGGFPRALYDLTYSPPGSPALAERITNRLQEAGFESELTKRDGIDHGVWIPLRLMYPQADIPLVQLSVPLELSPEKLFRIGQALAPFRREDALVLGSGGIVHNLRMFRGGPIDAPVEPWAAQFDSWFKEKLEARDVSSLERYAELAPHAAWAVPTVEHFAPVFLVLGAASEYSQVESIFEGFRVRFDLDAQFRDRLKAIRRGG